MDSPIFVVGMPRSRTAWMAAWLCIPHELMDGCYCEQDFVNRCTVGTSDSWLAWFPLRKYYPDAPVVVVHRPMKDVVMSLEDKFDMQLPDGIEAVLAATEQRMRKIDGAMHVSFGDIDDRLEEIWGFLKPNEKFDEDRTELYKNLNIQIKDVSGDVGTFKAFVGG